MTEIFEGQELGERVAFSNDLTFRGKPVKIDEETGIGYPEFSEEDLKSMETKPYVVFEREPAKGTIRVFYDVKDGKDFEGLTDAEKHTKLNSLSYQQGKPEATQLHDGSLDSAIGREAQAQRKEGSFKTNSLLKSSDSTIGINEKISKGFFEQANTSTASKNTSSKQSTGNSGSASDDKKGSANTNDEKSKLSDVTGKGSDDKPKSKST